MKTKLIGLIASVALMGSGTALAGGDWKKQDKQQQTQSQGSTGGSGITEGTAGQTGGSGQGTQAQQGSTQELGPNEIIGRVVKSNKKMVWVEHAGAVVPLKTNQQTEFRDPNLKRAQDFQEGDQVRVSFEIQKTDNIIKSIQKNDRSTGSDSSQGTGGSGTGGTDVDPGSDVLTPDTMRPEPGSLPPSPIENDMGGSGPDSPLNPPDVSDDGTSSNLGSDPGNRSADY